jgi:hypothetical protein
MNEDPNPVDEPLPEDPTPGSDPEPEPHFPRTPQKDHGVRPERLADNTKVTPLDDDKHIEEGIDVKET